jgi:hypothetical protein
MKRCLLLFLILLAGCGEKINIPEPVGLFSISAYYEDGIFSEESTDLAVINNTLFTITGNSLVKRSLEFNQISAIELENPTILCDDDDSRFVFVWDNGALSVFNSDDLTSVVSIELPEVQSVASMITCNTGIEADPFASTFLYIADPDSGVVHRYSWYEHGEASAFGILCKGDGYGARNIHNPAGMAVDAEGMMLVCETDESRNWVVRFDPTPDMDDMIDDEFLYRGIAVMFDVASCATEVEADFTLGDARQCGENDWTGGPSDELGEFHIPSSVQVDGSGVIYITDTMNNRFQMFTQDGYYSMSFGSEEASPMPGKLAVVDIRIGSNDDDWNYGAYLFCIDGDSGAIRKFISSEHYIHINQEPPPPPS